MDPLLGQLRSAYERHPGIVISAIVITLSIGLFLGYRLLGPAIFG